MVDVSKKNNLYFNYNKITLFNLKYLLRKFIFVVLIRKISRFVKKDDK